MPPGKHAVLSASGAKRWLSCPPSARLEEKLKSILPSEEGSNKFTAEGTKAHEVGELKLRREIGEINDFNYQERMKQLGEIDKEMDEATDLYVSIVMERLFEAKKTCPDAKLMLETRLDFSRWVPQGFGTGDAIVIGDSILDVMDLKYGKGVPVDAVDNPQARLYGLGALDLFGDLYDFKMVRNTIIQPRLDSVTTETLSRDELLAWAENEVMGRAQLAWDGRGEFAPGDHCRFCTVKAVCAARATEAMKVFNTGMDSPALLDEQQIPKILACASVAKSWIKDLEEYAQAQAINGRSWPGYKLVRGRSVRSWTDVEAVTDNLLRAGYKREDIFKNDMKSVSEIEKILGKKAFRAFAEVYTVKPEGKLTLVPESDKRKAVSGIGDDFADMGTIEN